jgi:hypothetical protein
MWECRWPDSFLRFPFREIAAPPADDRVSWPALPPDIRKSGGRPIFGPAAHR